MGFGDGDATAPGGSAEPEEQNSVEDSVSQSSAAIPNPPQVANSDVHDSVQLTEDSTEPEVCASPPLNYKRSREKQKLSGFLQQCKRSAPGCSKNVKPSEDADGPQAAKFKRPSYEPEENFEAAESSQFVAPPTEFTRTSENYGDSDCGELVVGDESDEDELVAQQEPIEDVDGEDLDGDNHNSANSGARRAQKHRDHYAMYFDDNSGAEEEQFEPQSDSNDTAASNQPVFEDTLEDSVAPGDRELLDALLLEANAKRNGQKGISPFDPNTPRGQQQPNLSVSSGSRHPPNSFGVGFNGVAPTGRHVNMTSSFYSGLRSRGAPSQQSISVGYHQDERAMAFPSQPQPAPPSAYGRGVRYSAASVGGNLNFNSAGLNNNNTGPNGGFQNVPSGSGVRRRPMPSVDQAALFDHVGLPPCNVVAVARAVATGSPNNPNPLHNWQATKSCLKDRFSFMFNNEILADVHFLVGRGDQRQRIPAHKFVLSVGSAVFDAMFNGHMAATEPSDIELPDVEPVAFLALLKFLYTDEYTFGPESVMTTLYTAKKYAVPSLENACVDFLKKNLSYDNAFMLLTQARLFDEPQLAALCLEMIDKHTPEAIGAEGFTDIDLETLCVVLERDTLRIREAALFAAVVRWSTEECHRQHNPVTPENQRQVLGRALSLIRFPLMTVEEFAQNAAQLGILTDREVVNLFLYFTVNPKPSVGFFDSPRCSVTGKEQVINRFQRIEGRWGYSGTPDRIKFTVDRRIFIVGFGLFGSIHGPTEYQVNIQIIHCGTGKVIGSNDTTFQCDGTAGTFRVMFKESVEVSPCITYIASATLKGPDSHYGTKGLRRIVHQSAGSGGMVTFQFTYAAGNNNGTSVEDGQIPEIIFHTKASS